MLTIQLSSTLAYPSPEGAVLAVQSLTIFKGSLCTLELPELEQCDPADSIRVSKLSSMS